MFKFLRYGNKPREFPVWVLFRKGDVDSDPYALGMDSAFSWKDLKENKGGDSNGGANDNKLRGRGSMQIALKP